MDKADEWMLAGHPATRYPFPRRKGNGANIVGPYQWHVCLSLGNDLDVR
jgi:hypothetical protein